MIQAVWMFIDELAGKGLDIAIVGKFLIYLMPDLTTKVVPLTVLLASIMTFGTFSEKYEFAAMKSSGFSLQRAMRPLVILMIGLGALMFYFSNTIIPRANQKSWNLRKNIGKLKPSFAITKGQFNQIEGANINIKVQDKYGENERFLKNVIIHKTESYGKNRTVIKATTGEFVSDENSDILQLVLKDGHYYEDIVTQPKNRLQFPHTKADFEKHIMNIDLSGLNNVDMDAEEGRITYKMQSVEKLDRSIDSISLDNVEQVKSFEQTISRRSGFVFLNTRLDTIVKENKTPYTTELNILEQFPAAKQLQILENASTNVGSLIANVKSIQPNFFRRNKLLNLHMIWKHDKFTLALSCVILFFVGAPLGAIIRKGGLGLPMVVAIGLFLTYYFVGLFTKNYAEDGSIHPIIASWISTLIMLPLGIILTKRATSDKGLIDPSFVVQIFKGRVSPLKTIINIFRILIKKV